VSNLPNNEVGISDILDYRECPQRFGFSMRRHLPMPERFQIEEGETAEAPESESYASSYGSAAHDAIEIVEKTQCSNKEAIDQVWPRYQHWLEPADADRMDADLDTYRSRSDVGYRLIGTEVEMRAPLFVYEGEMIYFRGRIDVLYQHLQNGAVFLSRDYKSSRFPKSEAEVHADLQQWAYNWLTHETYPECQSLTQMYDQLRYGDIPTRKSEQQRVQIKSWLIRQVTTVLNDRHFKPKQNQWCYTCPLKMDCRVTHMSTEWWQQRLLALAPQEKEGRKTVVRLDTEGDFSKYTKILPQAKDAVKVLERYVEAVEAVLKEMPESQRNELGFTLGKPRQRDVWAADAISRVMEIAGPDFPHVAGITKKAIEDMWGLESDTAQRVLALATKKQDAPSVKAVK
jgi:hypothetical protein